ncbi:hypothetical protein M409DRAFT_50972 [Zasmidium cellare ATCC 36951]|uniref:Uncharacterized protein n=1 Tax=Zasmidium cellare ATCC 36951 TaxID=1080233 RepID=A0A6A6CWZ8_ZASCE|nr:uncharacterized protein M409DRAFT_50972 [Zasmidium cellare ATCC 36951]KAF2171555.1 hypothetical protein M409DRAFT_50972 [Zasmidium cellare ATCC 36951]
MHFSTALLAIPILASAAFADEVVYLANCHFAAGSTGGQAEYYKEIANSQNGQNPDSGSVAHITNGSPFNFEGQNSRVFQQTGVTFQSNINAGANGLAVGAFAGTGNNGRPFNCFRDSKRQLDSACIAEYFCRDV